VQPALAWDPNNGGLKLTWKVTGSAPLAQGKVIRVYFASGPTYASRLGGALFSHTVPAGTPPGAGGPVAVPGALLLDGPVETTHMIAAAGTPSGAASPLVGAVKDVRIEFAASANPKSADAKMTRLVKGGLRAAGTAVGTITSTGRTPESQARIMYNNCANLGTASQYALYGTKPGSKVIDVYVEEKAAGASAADVQAAMAAKIRELGPCSVSRHMCDPATEFMVVDVAYSSFTASARPLFVNAVSPPRSFKIIQEDANKCVHIETTPQ
jgi:hypothetical protein